MTGASPYQDWTLAWWDWLFALTWWQGLLAALVIAPVGLWVWRGLMQGIWVNPFTHDWWASNFDVFLAGGIGAMLWLASTMPADAGHTSGWVYALLNYGSIVFWLGFTAFKWWDERKDVQTWSRRLGATTVYHIGVLVYIGGLYVILFVNTATASWTKDWTYAVAHMVPILAVGAWLYAGMVLDAKYRTTPLGQSKFVFTSPYGGWYNVRQFWRWFSARTDLAYQMQTLRPWNFIIDRYPIQGFMVLVMISPGAFLLLNWVMRGEWVPLSYQWYSALIGDVLLALFGAYCLFVLHHQLLWGRYPVFNHRFTHYVWIAVFYVVAGLHMWQESGSITTWERRLGPNAIYHNFVVYPLLGYVLAVLLWSTLKYSSWGWRVVTVGVAALLIGGWYMLGVYDGAHQYAPNGVSKHVYANPEDAWRNIRIMYEWIAGLF